MIIGNWPLMLMTLEQVIRHPKGYDQRSYRSSCGTTRCIAGWAAYFGGWRDVTGALDEMSVMHVDTHVIQSTEYAAMLELDIEPQNRSELGSSLFDGSLTFEDVLVQVYALAQEDGVTLTPIIITEMTTRGLLPVKEDAAV